MVTVHIKVGTAVKKQYAIFLFFDNLNIHSWNDNTAVRNLQELPEQKTIFAPVESAPVCKITIVMQDSSDRMMRISLIDTEYNL